MEEIILTILEVNNVRKTFYQNSYWFVLNDCIKVFANSEDPSHYLINLKIRRPLIKEKWEEFIQIIKINGSYLEYNMNCIQIEGLLFLIPHLPKFKNRNLKRALKQLLTQSNLI